MKNRASEGYIRSGIFGAEDAIISTTGIAIGLLTSTPNKQFILLALFVSIFVAALSAATSELISEETVLDIDKKGLEDIPIFSAIIMFFSYLIAGLIPAIPIVFLNFPQDIFGTIFFSVISFFILGFCKGKFSHRSVFKSILQVLVIGGAAAILGILVGYFFKV